MDDVAVSVKHLSKSFRLPHEQANGIKQLLVTLTRGRRKGYETQHVLNGLSFDIAKGEFFGIVGRNGSGKSTLLKLLAQIYVPDHGSITINGSLTPFIELGVGFNPELTGRENVYLNGALLGFSREDMDGMYDEIVGFAELHRFMDQKLKNYSSGMQVRLAFSIAIRSRSDILIMDEVLAVGDADFQKKCFDVFRTLKKEGRTIILVTHDMGNVEKFCDRVLIVDKGSPVSITTPSRAATTYARLNIDDSKAPETNAAGEEIARWGTGELKAANIRVLSASNSRSPVLDFESTFSLSLDIERSNKYNGTPFEVGLAFINGDGVTVAGPNSAAVNLPTDASTVTYSLGKLPLQPGDYSVTVAIINKETGEPFDFYDQAASFHIVSDKPAQGVAAVYGEWKTQ